MLEGAMVLSRGQGSYHRAGVAGVAVADARRCPASGAASTMQAVVTPLSEAMESHRSWPK
jgi:hypothetical protein